VRGGHGLMCALELVSDHARKTPIDKHTIQRLQTATYEAGVMLRVSGPNVIFSPPLIIDEADTAKILSAVDQGFASL
jgi:adenosylmethionine-8-amino-7-oxononanoate aminotransferase